ncbi:MAG: glucosamine-6-phosphate deaminase [Carnobacterium sp.]|uniref:glucosamine-6-phosphate deaminase n=1 Tax=unclassified Carnobacterium TaxID=257487 RepID=UPI0019128D99|nr:glucosamine-6-phosphate deaminase [Carnobacterium sp. CS13]QQP70602.1 glucosamine-6-phosphate deaminase [Carnobacterium sp. CS13]
METIIVKDNIEGGKKAFELIKSGMAEGAKVLGLATGSTPVPMYKAMVESDLDFSDMVALNLDEYFGLAADNPQSYHYFMEEQLFSHKPFKETYIPNGLGEEKSECARYDQVIVDHPIDIQILGIGTNAHIGFNEPGTSFDTTTRKVALTESTIESNKRNFDTVEEVPRYAYSMGIQSILSAKKIILMAFGEEKAEAIKKTLEGPVTEEVPASVLQQHGNVVLIVDEAAAKLIQQ